MGSTTWTWRTPWTWRTTWTQWTTFRSWWSPRARSTRTRRISPLWLPRRTWRLLWTAWWLPTIQTPWRPWWSNGSSPIRRSWGSPHLIVMSLHVAPSLYHNNVKQGVGHLLAHTSVTTSYTSFFYWN